MCNTGKCATETLTRDTARRSGVPLPFGASIDELVRSSVTIWQRPNTASLSPTICASCEACTSLKHTLFIQCSLVVFTHSASITLCSCAIGATTALALLALLIGRAFDQWALFILAALLAVLNGVWTWFMVRITTTFDRRSRRMVQEATYGVFRTYRTEYDLDDIVRVLKVC